MNIFIVCLLAISVRAQLEKDGTHDEWHTFKNLHGKQYATVEEESMRKSIFYKNKKMIEEHNSKYNNGQAMFKLKMNHFGDLLNHEYRAVANGFNTTSAKIYKKTFPIGSSIDLNKLGELPDSIDWREKGAVTPVKNQRHCGSCWSFSTTGALEAQIFRKTGKLISLSEQNLIDCSVGYGNNGCHGGLMTQAFQYINDNNGIDTEQSYPYEEKEGPCRFTPANLGGRGAGYRNIPEGSEEALESALALVGPVSVAVDASQGSFQFYSEGLYFDEHCSPVNLDHGILAVGYGNENGNDYWLVKNSWGPNWGEGGYVKMARNRNNHCGIASMASYPIV